MEFWTGTAFMRTEDSIPVARILDEAGFDGIVVSDHMIYPRELSSPYPSPSGKPMWTPDTAWPDSWVLIGAMAAVTHRIRFTNAVYVAPARPLLEVAKQVATAAVIAEGRIALSVGAGWMREEFELMGQEFTTRGKRLDEMIEALPALWRGGWVSWTGKYYRIPELMIEPHPPRPVPIMCGGESDAALRRAARLCDGWVGSGYSWDDAVEKIRTLTALRREYGRASEPFDIMLALRETPSVDLYKRAEDIGVTAMMCSPWARSDGMSAGDSQESAADRYRASIERFAEDILARMS
ncbi:TIGR03619 family F420-dependent LLM class oxidoreductase [Nocardia alni]|uniref:TIGR03619 family F420-dependent LLM class oxidoreductase n=1 Tax=Nocardia alni TaxID=2815723 RepID=UPI001C229227|nr:TIGR03619 family F420-dependent LLM class oxidoreductase [Nocardia alni]